MQHVTIIIDLNASDDAFHFTCRLPPLKLHNWWWHLLNHWAVQETGMSSSCLPMKADNLVYKLLIYTAGLAYLAIRFFETSTDCCTQSADDCIHSVSVIILCIRCQWSFMHRRITAIVLAVKHSFGLSHASVQVSWSVFAEFQAWCIWRGTIRCTEGYLAAWADYWFSTWRAHTQLNHFYHLGHVCVIMTRPSPPLSLI